MTLLDLNNNEFTGSVPSALCSVTGLVYWDIENNPYIDCYADCLSTVPNLNANPPYSCSNITSIPTATPTATPTAAPTTAATSTDIGLCGFIAATNIESIFSQWSCDSSGVTTTDPCDPTWDGIACSRSEPSEINVQGEGLRGSIPSTFGSLTAMDYLYLDSNCLTGGDVALSFVILLPYCCVVHAWLMIMIFYCVHVFVCREHS